MKIKHMYKKFFVAACAFALMSGQMLNAQITNTLNYTGSVQNYTVLPGVVTLTIDIRGGAGSNALDKLTTNSTGGLGGRVLSIMTVTPGQVLTVYVGGSGNTNGTGGFNGGGTGGASSAGSSCSGGPAGGGGGASDIRFGGITLGNRILVAAGGGGAGRDYCNGGCQPCGCGGSGGHGGGLSGITGTSSQNCGFSYGGSGTNGGLPGTPSSGGNGAPGDSGGPAGTAGVLGTGGDGGPGSYDVSGGGGGGGYYGGGGGGSASGGNGVGGGGGGGGSSYANSSYFTSATHTSGFQSGDGVVYISYDQGMALNFDGVNDYVNLGSSFTSTFSPLNKITLEAWVRPTSTTNLGVIVGNYYTAGSSMQFLLRRDYSAYSLWVDVGSGYQSITAGTVALNTWQHVAGVWDGSSLKLYVNGQAVGTTTGVTGSNFSSSSNPVFIGNNALAEAFAGDIDEVRIWKRALCQGEIQNNRNAELSASQTSLVAYYKFNNAVPNGANSAYTTLPDASANGLTGSLFNFALNGTTSNWVAPGGVITNSTVPAFVSPVISVNSGTMCSGGNFTINPSGALTYSYSGGSAVVSVTSNTTINVTGTNSVGCIASNTAVSSITVNANPTITVSSGTICNGQSFAIVASGASTYSYSGGSATVSPATNTVYNVTGTSAQGCVSSNTAVSSVAVNTVPVISVNSGSICTGKSFTIIASGANTYTYSGGSATVSPLTNTVYNVTGTSPQGCVSTSTAVSTVTVNITPTVAVNSGSICTGNTFTISASGASTYTYSGGTSLVSPLTNTIYNVTGTSAQGCVSSNTAVSGVTVFITPTVSVNSGSICAGSSFTMSGSGANTYSYSGGSAIVAPATNTSYNVTGASSQGCVSSNTAVSSVVVNTVPVVSVNSGSICAGSSFTMAGSGANTYTYSSGSAIVAPATNTSYNVTGTSAQGCVSSNTAVSSVVVNTVPVVSVNNGSICSGKSFTILPSGASTYTYSGGTGTVSPLTNTVYNVTGTSAQGCVSSNTAISSVTVNSTPVVSVNSGSICVGGTFVLIGSGASTYTFSSGSASVVPTVNTSYSVTGTSSLGCVSSNTAISSVVVNTLAIVAVNSGSICSGSVFTIVPSGASSYTYSSGSATVNPLTSASYSVTGTSPQGCVSSNTAVSTVSVYTTPTITSNSGTICAGQSFTIVASGASSYSYAGGSATVTPAASLSYSVIGSSTAGCVSASVISNVTVVANPTVLAVANSTSICNGFSTTLTASGASTYSWNTGSANTSIAVSPTTSTTYTVTGILNACSNSQTVTLVVNANPTSVITSTNVLCNNAGNGVATSVGSGGNGPYTYSWSPLGGSAATAGSLSPGVYTCVVTDINSCKNSETVSITQPSAINSSVIATQAPGCGLSNGIATVSANGGTGALTFSWIPTGGIGPIGVGLSAGNYTCVVMDANGCVNFVTQTLINPNGPTITATPVNAGCENETFGAITLSVTGGTPAYTFSWTPNVSTTLNATGLAAGVYSVSVVDINNCLGVEVYTLTQFSNPTIAIAASANTICVGESATLTASGALSYSWSTGSNNSAISISPSVTTVYTVIAQDVNGCRDTATVNQSVDACLGIGKAKASVTAISIFPNPNNGTFTIKSASDILLSITNELGQVVKTVTLTGSNNRNVSINELANGIYFVSGRSGNEVINQKVIVNR